MSKMQRTEASTLRLSSSIPPTLPTETELALYASDIRSTQAVPFKLSLMFISRYFYLYANVLVVDGHPEQKLPQF